MSVDGIETEATKASQEVTTYAAKVAEEIDKAHVTRLMANIVKEAEAIATDAAKVADAESLRRQRQ